MKLSSIIAQRKSIFELVREDQKNIQQAVDQAHRFQDPLKSNTLGKIAELCVNNQTDPKRYSAALKIVELIQNDKDKANALERILRNANRAVGVEAKNLKKTIVEIDELAIRLGISIETRILERAEKTKKYKKLALEETDPLNAFYNASLVPEGREAVLTQVVKTFTAARILAADKKPYDKEIQHLLSQKEIVITSENYLEQNKNLSKSAFALASYGLLDEAQDTLSKIVDLEIKKSSERKIGRLAKLLG